MRAANRLHLICVLTLLLVVISRADYDPQLALSALYYAKAAYCDPSLISTWSGDACGYHPRFTSITVYSNATYDMQAFSGYDPQANTIVVSFRGSANLVNWWEDFKILTIPFPGCAGCSVHKGFWQVYQSVNASGLFPGVLKLMAQHPSSPVLVTGHSLGAAVALLAAVDGAMNTAVGSRLSVYTFGEPRVGNSAFVEWAVGQLSQGKQFRVTHERDPVPHVPPMFMEYLHVPHELWYNNDGNTTFIQCEDSAVAEDETNCSDSEVPWGLSEHTFYLGTCTECSCESYKKMRK